MFGCFQVSLGLTLFFLGSRLLPSGQAALISTLETPLMPFWIWVGFGEVPTLRVLLGGALVMGAVIADIIGDSRTQRRQGERTRTQIRIRTCGSMSTSVRQRRKCCIAAK